MYYIDTRAIYFGNCWKQKLNQAISEHSSAQLTIDDNDYDQIAHDKARNA